MSYNLGDRPQNRRLRGGAWSFKEGQEGTRERKMRRDVKNAMIVEPQTAVAADALAAKDAFGN
jgi:hypothetical protein